MMRRSLRNISLATIATALATPAFAQQDPAPAAPTAASRTTAYDAAFFTAAAPRNALERLFFDPNRSTANPSAREFRERNRHVTFQLTLKQSFGGAAKKSAGVASAPEQG